MCYKRSWARLKVIFHMFDVWPFPWMHVSPWNTINSNHSSNVKNLPQLACNYAVPSLLILKMHIFKVGFQFLSEILLIWTLEKSGTFLYILVKISNGKIRSFRLWKPEVYDNCSKNARGKKNLTHTINHN